MKFLCYFVVVGLLMLILSSVDVFMNDWQYWAILGIIGLYQGLALWH